MITKYNIKDFKRGWVCGMFDNGILYRENIEVAVQKYKKGHVEPAHYHKECNEINIVVSGTCQIDEFSKETLLKSSTEKYCEDDIIVVAKNTPVQFTAITDCTMVVIKDASIPTDKYLIT